MNRTSIAQQADVENSLTPTRGVLQRKCACGNKTVASGECSECGKKKSILQRKLSIGASNDPLEREADRVADQVMAIPSNSNISSAPQRIQRFAGQSTGGTNTAPASVDRVLASSGRPLDPAIQQDMGQRFGHDFSQVRIHTDTNATKSARSVNALAYTVGKHIVFGEGQYVPLSNVGRGLIAHELTHTIQQQESTRIQRTETPINHTELLDTAINIVQQALDNSLEPQNDDQQVSVAGEERVRSLQTALDHLLSLKSSGGEAEILRAVQPILSAIDTGAGSKGSTSAVPNVQRKAMNGQVNDSLEREAEAVAEQVSQGGMAIDILKARTGHLSPTIQRAAPAIAAAPLVFAGPPGWAILAAIAVAAVVVGGVYLATRPRTITRAPTRTRTRPRTRRRGTCNELMTACLLTSMQGLPGSVHGQSRCVFCAEVCRRDGGTWPARAPTTTNSVRCDFWNF